MTTTPGVFTKFVATSIPVVNAVETVVASSPAVSSPYVGAIFTIEFLLDFLTGATVTSIVARVRRDSLTGTAIYTGPLIAAAASTQLPRLPIAVTDQLTSDVAGQVWVLTIVQTAGSSNGAATNAFSRVSQAG